MQKRALIIIGIIVLLAVIVGGVFYTMQNAKIKLQNDNVKSQNETADWKTYKNDDYRFSFEYPLKGIAIQKVIVGGDGRSTGDSNYITEVNISSSDSSQYYGALNILKLMKSGNGGSWVYAMAFNNAGGCFVDSGDDSIKNSYKYEGVENINNVLFYHYVNYPDFIGSFCTGLGGYHYEDVYRVQSGSDCYEIGYTRSDKGLSQANEIPETVADIISTVKFTK